LSVCTLIASDAPLQTVSPPCDYPLIINVDHQTIEDGEADDNFYLLHFNDSQCYINKKYAVYLEWPKYTAGRAAHLIEYISKALQNSKTIELWHIWLSDDFQFDNRPVIHDFEISIQDLTHEQLQWIDNAEIWNIPDHQNPNRPSFYRLTITS